LQDLRGTSNEDALKNTEIEIKKASFNLGMLLNDDGDCVLLRAGEKVKVEVLPDS
jgi:hypothetical protein